MESPLIELKNAVKYYNQEEEKTFALNGVSLEINKQDFVAVMGHSGSGKSTLLHILGLLDRVSSGEHRFYGQDIRNYSDEELAKLRNEKIGFVFQAFFLLARTPVIENVKLPLMYSKVPESQWDELALKAIEAVGLTHRIHHLPSQLSGGEKQRVAIARALVTNPDIIFADEPTGNLDSKSANQIIEIIRNLNRRGHTVIVVTHESYVGKCAERIIFLKDGKIDKQVKNKDYDSVLANEFIK